MFNAARRKSYPQYKIISEISIEDVDASQSRFNRASRNNINGNSMRTNSNNSNGTFIQNQLTFTTE